METVTLSISGMTCGHCVASVRRALETVPDLEVQSVRLGSAEFHVHGPESATATQAALAAVREAGYGAALESASSSALAAGGCACCTPSPADNLPLDSRSTT